MHINSKSLLTVIARVLVVSTIVVSLANGQHRGDKSAFQGLSPVDSPLLQGVGLNGAFSSNVGDIRTGYLNPAGLAMIEGMQFYISGGANGKLWQENQNYRPNRFFVTLPYYLEGLYVPDPANNGAWDYDLATDTSYHVEWPDLGLDPFSEEAADWQEEGTNNGLHNLALALPVKLGNRQIAIGAAYNRRSGLLDYDRNSTYLVPHPGYTLYNDIERANGVDTVQIDWSDFERRRTGDMYAVTLNLAAAVSEKLDLGVSLITAIGSTDDVQNFDKVGWFRMYKEQRFRFSYDTLATVTTGTSDFASMEIRIGGLLKLNNLNIAFSASLPRTITRKWDNTTTITALDGDTTTTASGDDKVALPANMALGVSFYPSEKFTFYMDLRKFSTGSGEYTPAVDDSLGLRWVDSGALDFGGIYHLSSKFDLRAGYHYSTAVFAPDGAAHRDEGPPTHTYSLGIDVNLGSVGKVFATWSTGRLKYNDSYYSNTNYALEETQSLTIGYVIGL
ncbi:hypothetical protein ACFL6E_06105 [Candidatus Neomarinimicrobiota bacterium]